MTKLSEKIEELEAKAEELEDELGDALDRIDILEAYVEELEEELEYYRESVIWAFNKNLENFEVFKEKVLPNLK